jgi:hypothetical protein
LRRIFQISEKTIPIDTHKKIVTHVLDKCKLIQEGRVANNVTSVNIYLLVLSECASFS